MQDAFVVVLIDISENILERITFYDIDSRPVNKIVSDDERLYYLREIRKDIRCFKRSCRKANLVVDIGGSFDAVDAASRVLEALPPDVLTDSTS